MDESPNICREPTADETTELRRFGPGKAPDGAVCEWCDEPITKEDSGFIVPHVGGDVPFKLFHFECFLRTILGSLGHQQHRCSCFGGDFEDPPDMTPRQAAIAVVAYWHTKNN